MNTRESGEKLIAEARRILERDVRRALDDGDHNLAVRRAQEVVELMLKGALKVLGIDYPKVHDVAPVFTTEARSRIVDLRQLDLERIEEISFWLSQARAPSFYMEKDYSEADAEKAFADATWLADQVLHLPMINPNQTKGGKQG